MNTPQTDKLEKVELTKKEIFIEWTINIIAFLMMLGFFLKVVFL